MLVAMLMAIMVRDGMSYLSLEFDEDMCSIGTCIPISVAQRSRRCRLTSRSLRLILTNTAELSMTNW